MYATQQTHEDLSDLLGKHFLYTYANGWRYELYIKNATTIDYRIHSGIVGGRWVNNQTVIIRQIACNVFKIAWDEPTGTFVCLTINLAIPNIHGTVCFPRWIHEHPEKTVCHQNDHIDLMRKYRDIGPTYDKRIEDNFAVITFMRDAGINNDHVIDCCPADLPTDYPAQLQNELPIAELGGREQSQQAQAC